MPGWGREGNLKREERSPKSPGHWTGARAEGAPAQGGQRPAPGLPLGGEGQRQEAKEQETTGIRSQ